MNGCPLHETPGFITHWDDRLSFGTRITQVEDQARSMLVLGDLGRCLISGPCSEREIPDYETPTSPHTRIAPWDLACFESLHDATGSRSMDVDDSNSR